MPREILPGDSDGLFRLYTQLHDNPLPKDMEVADKLFRQILADPAHHIIVEEENGEIISSSVCVIIPNLTHTMRPYALIENVVTDAAHRGRGFASACLEYARGLAEKADCYKIMLMTGSKNDSTLRFYERAGYNKNDKTAFIRWL